MLLFRWSVKYFEYQALLLRKYFECRSKLQAEEARVKKFGWSKCSKNSQLVLTPLINSLTSLKGINKRRHYEVLSTPSIIVKLVEIRNRITSIRTWEYKAFMKVMCISLPDGPTSQQQRCFRINSRKFIMFLRLVIDWSSCLDGILNLW